MLVAGNKRSRGSRRVRAGGGTRSIQVVTLIIAIAAVLPGCRVNDLSFKEDERVEIVSPEDQDEVALPFKLRWTVKDFEVVGPDGSDSEDAGYFAVLLDESPMPPGEGLDYFTRDDESCDRSAGCPDAQYFAERGIFPTSATSFEVETIEDTRPTDRQSAPDDHELTVILLNGKGERIGESAFRVDVEVDRGRD
jgi:hypothetical protein